MGRSREDALYQAQLKQYREEKRRMKREAARIKKILSKDPTWPLASGKKSVPDGEWDNFYRILACKTKQAVRLLYPSLPICIRWKAEDPKAFNRWIRVWVKVDPDIKKHGQTLLNIRDFLDNLGLVYDSFYSDDPDSDRVSCVIVEYAPYTVRHPEKA